MHGRGRGRGDRSHGPSTRANDSTQPSEKASLTCFKCGGKGHRANVCPSPSTNRTSGKPRDSTSNASSVQASGAGDKAKPAGTTPATVEVQAQSAFIEEVWSAIDIPLNNPSAPVFQPVEIDCSYLAAQCASTSPIPALVDFSPVAATAAADDTGSSGGLRVDIYDSGASRHMTPHRDRLSSFRMSIAVSPRNVYCLPTSRNQ